MLVFRIERVLRDLRLCDHTCSLSQHVSKGSRHGKSRVGLIKHPHPRGSQLLAWLRRSHRIGTLDGLNHKRLRVSVVDLTLVMVNNPVSLIRQFRLVVSRL